MAIPQHQYNWIDIAIETTGTGSREPFRIHNKNAIRSRSLSFRDKIDDALAAGRTNVDISTHDDASAIRLVLASLQQDVATLPGDLGDSRCLDSLARQCNVLWQYKCDPEPYHLMWRAAVGAQASVASRDQSIRSEPQTRCWHHTQHLAADSSRFAIALVLGLKEELAREIDILWRAPNEVKTAVPADTNVEGIKKEELEATFNQIVTEVNHLSTHDLKLAKAIRDAFKRDSFGDLSVGWASNQQAPKPLTSYELLRAFEYIVAPQDVEEKQHGLPSPPGELRHGKDLPKLDWHRLRHNVFDPILHIIEAKSKERNEQIQKILDNLDQFTRDRQRNRAETLLKTWRDPKVKRWKLQLKELEVSEQLEHLSRREAALVEERARFHQSMQTSEGEGTTEDESISDASFHVANGIVRPYPTPNSSNYDEKNEPDVPDIS